MSNPFLTLPPAVGNKYFYSRKDDDTLYECEIVAEQKYRGETIFESRGEKGGDHWTYWPDGEAKTYVGSKNQDYVAQLVSDIVISNISDGEEIKKLREKYKTMMERLKELEA